MEEVLRCALGSREKYREEDGGIQRMGKKALRMGSWRVGETAAGWAGANRSTHWRHAPRPAEGRLHR
jgi:hypothetical protein